MRNAVRIAALCMMLGITPAYGTEAITEYLADARKVGEGRLRVFMIDVYDATLFAPSGAYEPGKPLALKLSYLRSIPGRKIADRSVEEMRGLGITDEVKLAAWHSQMREIFPDVAEDVSLTGIYTKEGATLFFKDEQMIGRIDDPEFGRAFFNIWLSPETNAPDLRRKLLGQL